MNFNIDSKLVRIMAWKESEATKVNSAYGEIFLPYELYVENKEQIDNLDTFTYALDGSDKSTKLDVNVEITNVKELMSNYRSTPVYSRCCTETLCEDLVVSAFNLDEKDARNPFKVLMDCNDNFCKVLEPKLQKLRLNKDLEISGLTLEKGTVIEFLEKPQIKNIKKSDILMKADFSVFFNK